MAAEEAGEQGVGSTVQAAARWSRAVPHIHRHPHVLPTFVRDLRRIEARTIRASQPSALEHRPKIAPVARLRHHSVSLEPTLG